MLRETIIQVVIQLDLTNSAYIFYHLTQNGLRGISLISTIFLHLAFNLNDSYKLDVYYAVEQILSTYSSSATSTWPIFGRQWVRFPYFGSAVSTAAQDLSKLTTTRWSNLPVVMVKAEPRVVQYRSLRNWVTSPNDALWKGCVADCTYRDISSN